MEVPRFNRTKQQRYRLAGVICNHCDAKIFPPRDVCLECGGEIKTRFGFSGKGKIYSYQIIGNGEQAVITEASMIQTRVGVE